ncbi:hypothetical protein OE88DRAFT_1738797 [Heliocybe sulcata]|uniref:Uncharacterized protein n=1 Tax=Heliocybe sulcata TaxID=5364 RepID=A0A5C3MZZ2_9AGAM|nr:hypothetical protein OE88DRAFT_1738797 [Heliocybe sulcata]
MNHPARISSFELEDSLGVGLVDPALAVNGNSGGMGAVLPNAQAQRHTLATPGRPTNSDVRDATDSGWELPSSSSDTVPSDGVHNHRQESVMLDGPLHERIRKYREEKRSQNTTNDRAVPHPVPSSSSTPAYSISPSSSVSSSSDDDESDMLTFTTGRKGRDANQVPGALGTTTQSTVSINQVTVPKSEGSGGRKPARGSDA